MWQLSFKDKKSVLGPNIVAVGGKGSKHERAMVEAEDEPEERRTDETNEPVFYHSLPCNFWAEVIHSCSALAVLDLSASDEALPLACLRAGIPYTGLVMTPMHRTMLLQRLLMCTLSAAADESDPLYDCNLVSAIAPADPAPAAGPADTKAKAKKRAVPDGKAAPAAKKKAPKKAAPPAEEGEGQDDDDEEDPFADGASEE